MKLAPRLSGEYLLALASAVSLALLIWLLFHAWGYDDPFITYRFAHNLASGYGPVYNPGQPLLSTTTVLMVLLLAGVAGLGGDLPTWANLIGVLSLALGALALFDFAQRLKLPTAAWLMLVLYPVFPLLLSTLSSELPLTLALTLAAGAALARRRYAWMTLLSALALLARPDALVAVVLLQALAAWQAPAGIWRRLLGLALLLAPWTLFAWWYYGSPIPVTLWVKQIQGAMPISQQYFGGLAYILSAYTGRFYFQALSLLALIGLAWLGLAAWRRDERLLWLWLLLLLWPLAHFAGYSLLGVSRYFWYYTPLVVGLLATAGLGAQALVTLIARRWPQRRSLPGVLTALLCAVLLAGQMPSVLRLSRSHDQRLELYRAAGEWLYTNTPPQASVATLEVGIIGYYAQRQMFDFAGLLQPDIMAQLTQGSYEAAAAWTVQHYQPHYLVIQENAFAHLESDLLAVPCSVAHEFAPGQFAYPHRLRIYLCPAGQ